MLERVQVRLDEQQVGTRLDGQEPGSRNVDTGGVVEVLDGGTNGGLKLDDGFTRVGNLVVHNDLEVELVVVEDSLDRFEIHPDVVGWWSQKREGGGGAKG